MQPGLAGPKEWVEFHEGSPEFGECPVVIVRVIGAAIRTRNQTLGASIDTLNLRVYVPLLISNGVSVFIFLGQSLFRIMKRAASFVTGRSLVARVDMMENGGYLGGNARRQLKASCLPRFMPRSSRSRTTSATVFTNLLGGGWHFPNLGRRTANLRPGKQDGRQHSADFNAPVHRHAHEMSSGSFLWQMMCRP